MRTAHCELFSNGRSEPDEVEMIDLDSLPLDRYREVEEFVYTWDFDQEADSTLDMMIAYPGAFVNNELFWGMVEPNWGSFDPIQMVELAAELALEIIESEDEVFIDDRGPEDFGLEDLGSYKCSGAAHQYAQSHRRDRAGRPKTTGATRHFWSDGGGTGWKRMTRCRKQWERHGNFPVPNQGPLRPVHNLDFEWDFWVSPEANRREMLRLKKIREDAERERRRQEDLKWEQILGGRLKMIGPSLFSGMTEAEAEQHEQEYRFDQGSDDLGDFEKRHIDPYSWCSYRTNCGCWRCDMYRENRERELEDSFDARGPEDFGFPGDPPETKMGRTTRSRQGHHGPQWAKHKPRHKPQAPLRNAS